MIRLAFGINCSGKLVHISQVPSGLGELRCPGCGDALIAKKGEVRQAHFAHQAANYSSSCTMTHDREADLATISLLEIMGEWNAPIPIPPLIESVSQIMRRCGTHDRPDYERFYIHEQSKRLALQQVPLHAGGEIEFDHLAQVSANSYHLEESGAVVAKVLFGHSGQQDANDSNVPVLHVSVRQGDYAPADQMLDAVYAGHIEFNWVYHPKQTQIPECVLEGIESAKEIFNNYKNNIRQQAAETLQQFAIAKPEEIYRRGRIDREGLEGWLESKLMSCDNLIDLQPSPLEWYFENLSDGYRSKLETAFEQVAGVTVPDLYRIFAASTYHGARQRGRSFSWIELAWATDLPVPLSRRSG